VKPYEMLPPGYLPIAGPKPAGEAKQHEIRPSVSVPGGEVKAARGLKSFEMLPTAGMPSGRTLSTGGAKPFEMGAASGLRISDMLRPGAASRITSADLASSGKQCGGMRDISASPSGCSCTSNAAGAGGCHCGGGASASKAISPPYALEPSAVLQAVLDRRAIPADLAITEVRSAGSSSDTTNAVPCGRELSDVAMLRRVVELASREAERTARRFIACLTVGMFDNCAEMAEVFQRAAHIPHLYSDRSAMAAALASCNGSRSEDPILVSQGQRLFCEVLAYDAEQAEQFYLAVRYRLLQAEAQLAGCTEASGTLGAPTSACHGLCTLRAWRAYLPCRSACNQTGDVLFRPEQYARCMAPCETILHYTLETCESSCSRQGPWWMTLPSAFPGLEDIRREGMMATPVIQARSCENVGSGGCSNRLKRCSYGNCTPPGDGCDVYISCGPGNWDPPCPGSARCS